MKSKIFWSLAVLNVVLLAMFIMRQTRDNSAMAQRAGGVGAIGAAGRAGDYVMIPGEVTGGNSEVVYVIDTVGQQLSAVAYDDATQRVDAMPPVDLGRLMQPPGAVTPVTPRTGAGTGTGTGIRRP
jgi:hypothetical protein